MLPSSDNTGAFHFESVWACLDNLFGSSWLNLKMGKFELDNLLSEKRILTISSVAGTYANYHFQPRIPSSPLNAIAAESYTFGIGDNQVGVELMDIPRMTGPGTRPPCSARTTGTRACPPAEATTDLSTASQAFEVGVLDCSASEDLPTLGRRRPFTSLLREELESRGTGIGNKSFYRLG